MNNGSLKKEIKLFLDHHYNKISKRVLDHPSEYTNLTVK